MAQIKGILTLNEIDLLEVDDDPIIGAGTPASIGSQAINKNNGKIYSKSGSLNTDWNLIGSSSDDNVDGGAPETNYGSSITVDGGGV